MKLETGVEEGVLTITLNRPEVLNALDGETKALLQKALREAARNESVRAVLIQGAGRGFCSGEDLKSHEGEEGRSIGRALRQGYNPIVQAMRELPKPIVAKVQGVAAGAGFSLALAADIRLGSEGACFNAAFTKIGLVPDSGMNQLLPRIVGLGRALEIAYTARMIGAEEALAMGLLNAVHPQERLDEETLTLVRTLAKGPTRAFGLTKAAMTRSYEVSLGELLAYEADAQEAAGHTEDHREGLRAFLEKRTPRFEGR